MRRQPPAPAATQRIHPASSEPTPKRRSFYRPAVVHTIILKSPRADRTNAAATLRGVEEPIQPEAAPASLPPRILALDVGRKRIGLAITDPLGFTVQPLITLYRSTPHADVKSIGRVLRKHAVAEIVVGYPLHMSGEISPQALRTQAFADALRTAFGLPVHLTDERLSTSEAHQHLYAIGKPRQEHRGLVDQVAAVLILEGFLAGRAYQAARARLDPDQT